MNLFVSKKRRYLVPVAVNLLIQQDGKLLMLCRTNTGYEDGKWSVPAGHVDRGESATSAAVRETKEELGVTARELRFAHISHKRDPVDGEERIDLFFQVSAWDGRIKNVEPDKCSGLAWFSLDKLPPNTVEYVRHALAALTHGQALSEFGWDTKEPQSTLKSRVRWPAASQVSRKRCPS